MTSIKNYMNQWKMKVIIIPMIGMVPKAPTKKLKIQWVSSWCNG